MIIDPKYPNLKMKPVDPDCGDLMTRQDWIDTVKCGGFIDYDGYGSMATETERSNVYVKPSDLDIIEWPEWATHVDWYNR